MLRIKELRKKAGLTQEQFAEIVKVHQTAVSQWENGKTMPDPETVMKIASMFQVSTDYVYGRQPGDKFDLSMIPGISFPAARAVPILGTICAGNGLEPQESYDGEFFIDRSIKADFCLSVHGDSMVDEGIVDMDITFFVRNFEPKSGEIYAVIQKSENLAKVRKVFWEREKVILCPCNRADKRYSPEIFDEDEVFLAGLLVGVFHGR